MRFGDMVFLTENALEYALKDATPGSLEVDLSVTVFVPPVGLVVLATLLDRARTEGWPVVFVPPANQNVANYLSRMGLAALATEAGCLHGLPVVAHHDPNDRFVELRRFGAGTSADDLIDMILARLAEWHDDTLREMLYGNFYELALNVEEHAQRPGFLAAQYYPSRGMVAFAMADWGIGIRASLESAGHTYPTAGDAVIAAATTRVSRKTDAGGAGLRSTVKNVLQWKGQLRIRSSGVRVRFVEGSEPRAVEQVSQLLGTVISVEFPSYSRGR